jgi:hypothetical protein
VSRLPLLEAQLVDAAARRRRRRAPRRIALGLAAAACAAGALIALAPLHDPDEPVPVGRRVPAQTLALSRELTRMPRPPGHPGGRIPHGRLASVASEIAARTPYPPGMRDAFDWASTTDVRYRVDVQRLVEYRAYCVWLKFWLTGSDRAAATVVIGEIPRWPTQRESDRHESAFQRGIVDAARAGDTARIAREVDTNCRGV